MMNRYFFYLVLLNMLSNIIVYVPSFLLEYRYNGAIMSILISIVLGISLSYLFIKVAHRFPEKGLPDLIEKRGVGLKAVILSGFIIIWVCAGLLTLIGYIDIVSRFINPEVSKVWLAAIFLVVICFVIQMPTKKVMYLLEIILMISVPFIGFIFFKALTSEYISWDSVFEISTYALTPPSLKTIAVATYVFSGYTNIIIFNRLFKDKIKTINFVLILVFSVVNLFTTFFIPIGIHGADSVHEYIYPWISTADSLRLGYGPIERVLFIFIMLYIGVATISISIHWHVAFEMLKGIYEHPKDPNIKKNGVALASLFLLGVLSVKFVHGENMTNTLGMIWLNIRFYFEIFIVVFSFLFLKRRGKT